MRIATRIFLGVVLAGSLAAMYFQPSQSSDELLQPAIVQLTAPAPEGLTLRIFAKYQLARDVAAGRRSLVEAAALFGALNRLPPALEVDVTELDLSFRPIPVRTEADRLCWQVMYWVENYMQHTAPAQAPQTIARLQAEFADEVRRHGAVRLPDPATLEPVGELLRRAGALAAARTDAKGPDED